MKHPRTTIRETLAALLREHLAPIDARLTERIHVHRSTPLFASKLPAILIYSREERIEPAPHGDPGLRCRVLDLAIEIVTSGANADEEADRLAWVVEGALEAHETLAGLIEGSRLVRTEIAQDGDSDTPILAARLLYELRYWTRPQEEPGVVPQQVFYHWLRVGKVSDVDGVTEHDHQQLQGSCDKGLPCLDAIYPTT